MRLPIVISPQPPLLPFQFYLGPFHFISQIDIPELRGTAGAGTHTVEIRAGGVPASLANAAGDEICQVTADEYLLNIQGTARYYVSGGNRVQVEIAPGTPISDVSTYLLGSVFGVLCHQNGMLPLHASAIDTGNTVAAFLGESGAGKSTLAACLQRRGHRIVSDDICLLEPDSDAANSPLHVVPVAGWLKLWNNSLEHLGETPVEENRVFSTDDKFRLYLSDAAEASPSNNKRLGQVIFLARTTDQDAQPTLERLPLLQAISALMDMTYAGYVPEISGNRGHLFQLSARALADAQVWRLTSPWSLDRIDSVLNLLESSVLAGQNPKP